MESVARVDPEEAESFGARARPRLGSRVPIDPEVLVVRLHERLVTSGRLYSVARLVGGPNTDATRLAMLPWPLRVAASEKRR